MREQVEVVYENGVFRPVGPLLADVREHQHLTITIEGPEEADRWPAADAAVSLEAVRQALAKVPGTLAQGVHAEREER